MNSRTRQIIVGICCIALGLIAIVQYINGSQLLATALLGAAAWVIVEWIGYGLPEAWILAVALVGYIVGNRGFAQLTLSDSLPILPAEAVLAIAGLSLFIRALIRKENFVRADALNITLLIWMLYATARLPSGLKDYGFLAIRDYAVVYYAAFFFLAQWLADKPSSMAVLERAFTIGFVALPPVVILADKLFPDFFLDVLTIRGVPIIFHKSDLIAASLGAGTFWFWGLFEQSRRRIWLIPSAACFLTIPILESPRAAMVGICVVLTGWLLARRFRLLGFLAALAAGGIAVSIPLELSLGTPIEQTKAFGLYERVISIGDLSGTHTYESADAISNGDNNQFRVVWWRAVYEETMDNNPVFGLGFGYDLAARFLADYNWLSIEEDFAIRSPHSIVLTMFGRLGILGIVLFGACGVSLLLSALRAFRGRDFKAMTLWSVVGVIGVSASLGVVLEGPMGAVVFWLALGLAHASTSAKAKELADEALLDKAEAALSQAE